MNEQSMRDAFETQMRSQGYGAYLGRNGDAYRVHSIRNQWRAYQAGAASSAKDVERLREALREIIAINNEDAGTFRKRGGTRRGLSIVAAKAALDARATGEKE